MKSKPVKLKDMIEQYPNDAIIGKHLRTPTGKLRITSIGARIGLIFKKRKTLANLKDIEDFDVVK